MEHPYTQGEIGRDADFRIPCAWMCMESDPVGFDILLLHLENSSPNVVLKCFRSARAGERGGWRGLNGYRKKGHDAKCPFFMCKEGV